MCDDDDARERCRRFVNSFHRHAARTTTRGRNRRRRPVVVEIDFVDDDKRARENNVNKTHTATKGDLKKKERKKETNKKKCRLLFRVSNQLGVKERERMN